MPRSRVLRVCDGIAAGTHHEAPELGVCKAASVLGKRSQNTGRRTFFTGAKEAESCGLIHRASVKPQPGVRFQASVYYLDARLIEAAATGYRGELLIFKVPFEPPAKQGGSSEAKSKRATAQHRSAGLAKQVISKAKKQVISKAKKQVISKAKAPAKPLKNKENTAKHCTKPQECNHCPMTYKEYLTRPPLGRTASLEVFKKEKTMPVVTATGGAVVEAASAHAPGSTTGADGGLGRSPGSTAVHGCSSGSGPFSHLVRGRIILPEPRKRKKKSSQTVVQPQPEPVENHELVDFLEFFGPVRFELDFQARLKTVDAKGKRNRGGRLWHEAGDNPAMVFSNAQEAPARLCLMLWHLAFRRQKTELEGVLRALGDHSVLMLDDLDAPKLAEVGRWWQGQRAAIETSPGNHQVFLKADRLLTSAQRETCQRALAARFGCDDDATQGGQMHRYPGSVNHKDGGAFRTRLVAIREARGGDVGAQVDELLAAVVAPTGAANAKVKVQSNQQPIGHENVQARAGDDPSKAAFAFACRGLAAGVAPDVLAGQIAERFDTDGKHARSNDGGIKWAKRTIENAGVKTLKRPAGWYLS